jgi:hypothetical protein
MADIRITSPGGQILYYTLAQFTANANVVYPANTIIWLKDTDGYCKIADGVTTLGNLPFKQISDLINDNVLFNKEYQIFHPFYNGTTYEGMFSYSLGNILTAISSNIRIGTLVYVPYNIVLYSMGVYVGVGTTNNINVRVTLYSFNMNTLTAPNKVVNDILVNYPSGIPNNTNLYLDLPTPQPINKGWYIFMINQNFTLSYLMNNIPKFTIFNKSVGNVPMCSYRNDGISINTTNPSSLGMFNNSVLGTILMHQVFFKYTLNI